MFVYWHHLQIINAILHRIYKSLPKLTAPLSWTLDDLHCVYEALSFAGQLRIEATLRLRAKGYNQSRIYFSESLPSATKDSRYAIVILDYFRRWCEPIPGQKVDPVPTTVVDEWTTIMVSMTFTLGPRVALFESELFLEFHMNPEIRGNLKKLCMTHATIN